MSNFAFRTGTTFKLSDLLVRVIGLHGDSQVVLQSVDTGAIELYLRPQLLEAFRKGEISVVENEYLKSSYAGDLWDRPLEDLPLNTQQELRRRKHYIDSIYKASAIFHTSEVPNAIASAAKEINDIHPPSPSTLYRWFSKYRSSDCSIRSLIPRTDKRGSQELKQSHQMVVLMQEAFADAFQKTPAATMKTIETQLAAKISKENSFRAANDQMRMPSRRTLYRVMERIEMYDQVRLKEGKAIADRRLRITKKVEPVKDILERVEMDHTPLDLFLIDERTWLPLGRPTLTVALDCYSRMILGYYLSYGGTSATAVLGALRHAILPKEKTMSTIPGLDVNHAWPCYGLMDCLVLDNGLEFHGTDLERVALDFGMSLQFCPTRVPQFKGRVERMLKTINYSFSHQLPGTSMARFINRGAYDSQKHALLTLAEFKHAFEKWLLDDYAETTHRGIQTTPAAKWAEGVRRRQPELPSSLSLIRRRIGKSADRSLRHDGIWLHGIRYSSDQLNTVLRTYGRGVRVRVVYDPEDLEFIEVWSPEDVQSTSVPAVDSEYARGLTLYQHKQLAEILRETGRSAEDQEALRMSRIQLSESIEELMISRKQRKRKEAARLHGKTSSYPEREFVSAQPQQKKAISKREKSFEDELPKANYSFIHSAAQKGGR